MAVGSTVTRPHASLLFAPSPREYGTRLEVGEACRLGEGRGLRSLYCTGATPSSLGALAAIKVDASRYAPLSRQGLGLDKQQQLQIEGARAGSAGERLA